MYIYIKESYAYDAILVLCRFVFAPRGAFFRTEAVLATVFPSYGREGVVYGWIDLPVCIWGDTLVHVLLPLGIWLVLFLTPNRFDPLIPWGASVRLGGRWPFIGVVPAATAGHGRARREVAGCAVRRARGNAARLILATALALGLCRGVSAQARRDTAVLKQATVTALPVSLVDRIELLSNPRRNTMPLRARGSSSSGRKSSRRKAGICRGRRCMRRPITAGPMKAWPAIIIGASSMPMAIFPMRIRIRTGRWTSTANIFIRMGCRNPFSPRWRRFRRLASVLRRKPDWIII